jgi:hypothetical protein
LGHRAAVAVGEIGFKNEDMGIGCAMDDGLERVEDTGNNTLLDNPPIIKNIVLETVGETDFKNKDAGIFNAKDLGLEFVEDAGNLSFRKEPPFS